MKVPLVKVPQIRLRSMNERDVNTEGDYVLYWMTAFRRIQWNFGLQRAGEWASELNKPLVVLEALRCGYRWANDRLHHFVIQGMADNEAGLRANRSVAYYPYLEPEQGAGKGLLEQLGRNACVVVGDDYPCFFLPHMHHSAARRLPVRFELVDSNGLLPLRASDKVYLRAHDFRRFVQKNLREHLKEIPKEHPLQGFRLPAACALPDDVTSRWPPAKLRKWFDDSGRLSGLPIDHSVSVTQTRGGTSAGERTLQTFLQSKLHRYGSDRNEPEQDATSGLSPYLHFGHLSAHQIFGALMEAEQWGIDDLAENATGSSSGWWGVSAAAECFLDELITWREVGYNMCSKRSDYDQYESLPEWAQTTLADHANDHRETVYSLAEFEGAHTHDELWNAAQRQLLREGRMHNYLRMLWGKKILEWSNTPRDALKVMIELNNKYALDGRDPNSYSGIFWCLGRYDRAWGPERPIFGKVRYMSSENTARKLRVGEFLNRYSE